MAAGFSIVERPYAVIAAEVGADETAVFSDVGPSAGSGRCQPRRRGIRAQRVGATTLAALAAPPGQIEAYCRFG